MAGLIAAIVIAYVRYLDDSEYQEKEEEEDRVAAQLQEYAAETNAWLRTQVEANRTALENERKDPALAKKRAEYLRAVESALRSAAEPVRFHGRVIFADGTPVEGANVDYAVRTAHLPEETHVGRVKTDENGSFVIAGEAGTGLQISSISKAGVYVDVEHKQRFAISQDGSRPLAGAYTKSDPYTYHAWKLDKPPRLEHKDRVALMLTPDGRKVTVSLRGESNGFIRKGVTDGDFTISLSRNGEQWSAEIRILRGGIVETLDDPPIYAPESGYTNTWSIVFDRKGQAPVIKRYYYRTSDGYFASLTLDFRPYPYRRGKGAVFLTYSMNLDGGRFVTNVPGGPR